ncbi:MAG: DNA methyltransferase [Limnohabitans sp.]|nr:DNA methyltransferase [Limnohabitans sp.]
MNMLKEIEIAKSWSFSEKTTKDTSYITHGYYTYPAKFIPQLAQRLIVENSNNGDIIIDPFSGSGTTVLESIVNHRIGKGTDINEIATLIAKVKTTPINPILLSKEFTNLYFDITNRLNRQYDYYLKEALAKIPKNERIDYWFKNETKNKLAILLTKILENQNNDIRDFFLVSFAQILKTCSIWMQKSVKPTRDLKKKDYEPIKTFFEQTKKMIKKHAEFDKILNNEIKQNIDNYREIKCQDARNLPCEDEKATLIVTSPPYVTSYEYADLHQLPLLWFGYLNKLSEFRKKFMGSAYKERKNIDLQSNLASEIVTKLGNNKKSKEVKNYFADMLETWIETKRVLKKGGRACIVIGNTQFNGVEILNAEVFKEQFENIGFKTHKIIHREIPSKMLPSTRDAETGRFAKTSNTDKLAYPTEYILIMEKL